MRGKFRLRPLGCLHRWRGALVAAAAVVAPDIGQPHRCPAARAQAVAEAEAAPPAAEAPGEAVGEAAADGPRPGAKWVRIRRDGKGRPLAMQTAIVRYVLPDDYQPGAPADSYRGYLDLVGAVHIGDASYYRQLNRRFADYDAVLYELVAPEGTVVPRGEGTSSNHPLGALQNGMKTMLEVEHQLEKIDYTRENFVHADLSPDEFMAAMNRRGDGFVEMYFRMLGTSLGQQSQQAARGQSSDLDFLSAMFSRNRPRQLKIAMAKQFEGMESLMVGLSGADGSTLITDRNQRALDVLQRQLGEGVQRIAIFYGAGHLAEMDDQLRQRFGHRAVAVEWLDAWDLR